MSNESLHILKHYWGYPSFRTPQQAIIDSVLAGKDTLALLPTGGGKSLCFQVPALQLPGVCLVISPLIALMQDQVQNLTNRGIKAATIEAGSTQDELIRFFDNIRFGNYKFLYMAPERLQSRFIQEKIKQLPVNLIAIDEAHCISEWGHDFRPSYLQTAILRELLPKTPVIALTATATPLVLKDIEHYLQLEEPAVFKKSFRRENLAYQLFPTEDKLDKLVQIFKKIKEPCIVYVSSRQRTKEISSFLNAQGFASTYYHGGMRSEEKNTAFTAWMEETHPIMVATNAFGMGIDKPNVRVVVHLNLPSSLENYIQEAGRAGRDGHKAFAVLLSNEKDLQQLRDFHEHQTPNIDEIKLVHQKLYQHFRIAKGELLETPVEFDFAGFCSKYKFPKAKAYSAILLLASNGLIELGNYFARKSTLQFSVSSKRIVAYSRNHPNDQAFIQTVLRIYGGVFEQETTIDEFFIAKKSGLTSTQVKQGLTRLASHELIQYQPSSQHARLHFLVPREDDLSINRISKHIKSFLKQKKKKLQEVLRYAQNKERCRAQLLLEYFDESPETACGICDICLQRKKNTPALGPQISHIIKQHNGISAREICQLISAEEADILIHLRKLLASEQISLIDTKFYSI